MNTPTRPILTVLGLAAVGVAAYATPAHAANCGGQSAAPQPVPYQCETPGKVITFAGVTRTFFAVVHANGNSISVDFTMSAPLPVAVPIRIVHHVGISGAGLGSDEASGVIPAGATTATLTDSAPCRAGQLDMKAVDTSNGSGDKFRVGGPWIENGTGCIDTQTIPTTAPVATLPATTVPVATTPGAPTTAAPTPTTVASRITALPATGFNTAQSIAVAGIVLLSIGAFLVTFRRRSAS